MEKDRQSDIIEVLRENILNGKYTDRFPSERALMSRFHVTRSAVRSALAKLERQGVISRKRGSGAVLTDHAQNRASGLFGVIIPDAKKPFYAAMIDGVSKAVKNSGGGAIIRYLSPMSELVRPYRGLPSGWRNFV